MAAGQKKCVMVGGCAPAAPRGDGHHTAATTAAAAAVTAAVSGPNSCFPRYNDHRYNSQIFGVKPRL